MKIAETPKAPYYAVIFTSVKDTTKSEEDYAEQVKLMRDLAEKQSGFLGFETAESELEISISYWEDVNSIMAWKMNTDHLESQKKGKNSFYDSYKVRIAQVQRDYDFSKK